MKQYSRTMRNGETFVIETEHQGDNLVLLIVSVPTRMLIPAEAVAISECILDAVLNREIHNDK